jgi:hypothetical protein
VALGATRKATEEGTAQSNRLGSRLMGIMIMKMNIMQKGDTAGRSITQTIK